VTHILVSIPCRGRFQFLPDLLRTLAATKTDRSTIVVVSNGPEPFPDPGLPGIHVVHIGDVPTIPVAVNFAWYALRQPHSILVKLDNDVEPPEEWEQEILELSETVDLGGFLRRNERLTPVTEVNGRAVRRAHMSETWGMRFLYGCFIWLSPSLASRLGYEDERFVRSDDGDLGERTSRVPDATVAYSADRTCRHLARSFVASTEPEHMVHQMYQATDQLIKALPEREIFQPTIWRDCLSQDNAASIIEAGGTLPTAIEARARQLLREKLDAAFAPIGWGHLAERIFKEI